MPWGADRSSLSPAGSADSDGSRVLSVGSGDLAPDEAAVVAGLREAKRKAIETVELERRLAALEQRSGNSGE